MSDTLLEQLGRSADPEDRRVAGLLAPLAPGGGTLAMPAADEALSGFLVEVLGVSAPAALAPDPGQPPLVVQLGRAPVGRSAPRLRPALLAAAAAIAVVTAVGAAAATGFGRAHDGGVVVTPAVTTPHPTGSQRVPDDPVARGRSTPTGTGVGERPRRHDVSTHLTTTEPVVPATRSTGEPGAGRHHLSTRVTNAPTPEATDDDGSGGDTGSDGDATVGPSGGDDDATATPTPTPTPTDSGDGTDGTGGTDG